MKTLGFSFGKVLPIVLGAFLLVGCNKNVASDEVEVPESESPVPIKISAGNPMYVMTKAALEKWDGSNINVFGLRRKPGDVVGNGIYTFNPAYNIVDYSAATNPSTTETTFTVYRDAEASEPFFYAEGYLYDFYGYYLGQTGNAATVTTPVSIDKDVYSFGVEFDGSQDIMYAIADKEGDIIGDVSVDDIYSAWAARRGVHPTLVFNHALARLNFIVQGQPVQGVNKFEDVQIAGVQVKSVNKGTLTVTGPEAGLGFVLDPEAETAVLSLKDAEGNDISAADVDSYIDVTENVEKDCLGGANACIMVAPGMTQIELSIHMYHKGYEIPLDSYRYIVKASDVVKKDEDGNVIPVTEFQAGYQYDFYIYVYGPEEIRIKAEIAEWEHGGNATLNPDQKPGEGSGLLPDDEPVSVTGVSLTPSEVVLEKDKTQKLTPVFTPYYATNRNVTWKSSDDAVATVSADGVVTAVEVGTATITVTTEDGGKTATCAVTVSQGSDFPIDDWEEGQGGSGSAN